jgi:hypothetical protein
MWNSTCRCICYWTGSNLVDFLRPFRQFGIFDNLRMLGKLGGLLCPGSASNLSRLMDRSHCEHETRADFVRE